MLPPPRIHISARDDGRAAKSAPRRILVAWVAVIPCLVVSEAVRMPRDEGIIGGRLSCAKHGSERSSAFPLWRAWHGGLLPCTLGNSRILPAPLRGFLVLNKQPLVPSVLPAQEQQPVFRPCRRGSL